MDLERALKIAISTGKVRLGEKTTIKSVKLGKAKLVILANNCKKSSREDVLYYLKFSPETKLYEFNGTNFELGALCGKPFSVSMLAIEDPGESDILSIISDTKKGV